MQEGLVELLHDDSCRITKGANTTTEDIAGRCEFSDALARCPRAPVFGSSVWCTRHTTGKARRPGEHARNPSSSFRIQPRVRMATDDPVVVAVPRCGLGNRLTMLGRACALATTIPRNVSAYWLPEERYPMPFTGSLELQRALAPRLSLVDVQLRGPKPRWTRDKSFAFDPFDLQQWPALARLDALPSCDDGNASSSSCVVNGCSGSLAPATLTALDLNDELRQRFQHGCRSMLRAVRPVAWVQQIVAEHLPKHAIGVHIRGGEGLVDGHTAQRRKRRRLSASYSDCSPPEAMADAALRHERASSVVAFVAAGGESLIGRFRTALSQRGSGHWSLVTAMDLLRRANQTWRLPAVATGSETSREAVRADEKRMQREELVALVDMWALASTTRIYRPPMSSLSRAAAVWRSGDGAWRTASTGPRRPVVIDVFHTGLPHCALAETLNSAASMHRHSGQGCREEPGRVVRCHGAFDDICDPRAMT